MTKGLDMSVMRWGTKGEARQVHSCAQRESQASLK